MPRFQFAQTSFSSGQVSPKLHARTDINEFVQGAEEMKNFLPYPNGGASYRPGNWIKNNGVSLGDPDVSLIGAHIIPFSFPMGEAIIYIQYTSNASAIPTFTIDAELHSPDDGTTPVVIYSTQARDSVMALHDAGIDVSSGWHYAQKDEILIAVHNSGLIPPIIFSRQEGLFGVSQVSAQTLFEYTSRNQYLIPSTSPNVTSTTIYTSTATVGDTGTFTASSAIFLEGHIGNYFILDDGEASPKVLVARIDDVTGPFPATTADITVIGASSGFPTGSTNDTEYWYEPAWSGVRGYPRSVCLYQNRFAFGGNREEPSTLWFSNVGTIEMNQYISPATSTTFEYDRTPTGESSAFNLTIASGDRDNITFLASVQSLVIGTRSREYTLTQTGEGLGIATVLVEPQSAIGSAPLMPCYAENKIIFISRDRRSIIQTSFSENVGGFATINLSNLSDEILFEEKGRSDRYKELSFQGSRSCIWAVTERGALINLTINDATGVLALSKHVMKDTFVRSASAAYSVKEGFDVQFISATQQGQFLERATLLISHDDFEQEQIIPDTITRLSDVCNFLDFSALLEAGSDESSPGTWEVPPMYDGTILVVLSDGTVLERDVLATTPKTIENIPVDQDHIIVGIPYEGKLTTLNFEVGANQLLNSQGDIRRIDRATLLLYRSWGGEYGVTTARKDLGTSSDMYDMRLPFSSFTGRFKVEVPASPDLENKVVVKNRGPFPLNILGMVFRGQNNT